MISLFLRTRSRPMVLYAPRAMTAYSPSPRLASAGILSHLPFGTRENPVAAHPGTLVAPRPQPAPAAAPRPPVWDDSGDRYQVGGEALNGQGDFLERAFTGPLGPDDHNPFHALSLENAPMSQSQMEDAIVHVPVHLGYSSEVARRKRPDRLPTRSGAGQDRSCLGNLN